MVHLALAALAAFALPAAASTDASFTAALSQAPAGLAVMTQLKTLPQRPAAAQSQVPTAPADAWKKIIDKVKRDGVKGADGENFTQTLTAFSGDRNFDYEAYRVTVIYYIAANKNLEILGVEFDHEQGTKLWTLNLIGTDHWNMLADSSGKAGQAIYEQSTYKPETSRIPGKAALVDLADPRVKASFDKMIAFWSTR